MKRSYLKVAIALSFFLVVLPITSRFAAAQANVIDTAKAANQIGERYDGYLGVVDPKASEDIRVLTHETNVKRRAKYEEIARTNGISTGQVGRIAGAKLLEQAATGQHVMPREGEWVVK
ncbi:MAG: YdbL family protein [Deltaproteobacteria bacterium]|nr:YdbL family protein [Deltaproteobacteria bacterium]